MDTANAPGPHPVVVHVRGTAVHGVGVDAHTRCAHYHGPTDVVAIKFTCCDTFYSCHLCHQAVASHAPQVWPRARFNEPAVLCGACGSQLTVTQYIDSGNACPHCKADFNPRCSNHYHLYFETAAY
jgi:uncharacterized CHY-type Zn-finger protein